MGDTSSNGWFSIVMLVFWGVFSHKIARGTDVNIHVLQWRFSQYAELLLLSWVYQIK